MAHPQVDDEDVEFGAPDEMLVRGISQARWDRVRKDIDVQDVLFLLHGRRGSPIRCPFHGRDSSPSFYTFRDNNDCHCYGCPPGDDTWDNVKIVARSNEISPSQALRWLEREFNLPPLANGDVEEGVDLDAEDPEAPEPEQAPLLQVKDLARAFQGESRRLIRSLPEGERGAMVHEMAKTFFTAQHYEDPAMLARVVGAEVTRNLIQNKQAHA